MKMLRCCPVTIYATFVKFEEKKKELTKATGQQSLAWNVLRHRRRIDRRSLASRKKKSSSSCSSLMCNE